MDRVTLLPNAAFTLLAAGVAGCIWELVRPGRIVPGIAGLGAVAIAAYGLWSNHPTQIGLACIGFSLLPLGAACSALYRTAGLTGSIGLSAGFILLFNGTPRIAPQLAIPVCTAFSCIAAWLLHVAVLRHLRKRTE
jgi:membrane-bound ClpP family serine protease